MILLPLLIREKVEFYYDRQEWLDKIKLMHQQYKKYVKLTDCQFANNSTFVTWVMQHYEWHPRLPFLPLDGTEAFRMVEGHIHQFNKLKGLKTEWSLPDRYYYSSGLNDPSGYK
jgi:hypothetical protein